MKVSGQYFPVLLFIILYKVDEKRAFCFRINWLTKFYAQLTAKLVKSYFQNHYTGDF